VNFRDHQRNWNKLGEIDPLWAILSDPRRKGNGWNKDEFFKTGEAEIEWLMDYVGSLPVKMRRGEALDFGCGVGRVTQALCKYFDHCSGVDIAGSMIRLANEYNRHDNRCRYYLNGAEDLRMFSEDRFDLIYSNIVLQHMEPEYSTIHRRVYTNSKDRRACCFPSSQRTNWSEGGIGSS
jgi:ubiquinone/menaquinone biosynthesis C-methylase UbiE